MRFNNYLLEETDEQLVEKIRKECSQWQEEMKTIKVFRGTKKTINGPVKLMPRKDRRPLDTPLEVHEELDKKFKKKFGWKVRSEGVFATNRVDIAEKFGRNVGIMFPCNGYRYVYNKEIMDLTETLQKDENLIVGSLGGEYTVSLNWYDDKKRERILNKIISGYTNKGLYKASWDNIEIMFDCPNGYYLFGGNDFWSRNYYDIVDGYEQ